MNKKITIKIDSILHVSEVLGNTNDITNDITNVLHNDELTPIEMADEIACILMPNSNMPASATLEYAEKYLNISVSATTAEMIASVTVADDDLREFLEYLNVQNWKKDLPNMYSKIMYFVLRADLGDFLVYYDHFKNFSCEQIDVLESHIYDAMEEFRVTIGLGYKTSVIRVHALDYVPYIGGSNAFDLAMCIAYNEALPIWVNMELLCEIVDKWNN